MKLFFACLLLHLVADFTLQGCLANMKQKSWWEELFKNSTEDCKLFMMDYKCALICHSLYWTLVTFAPIIFFMKITPMAMAILVVTNTIMHAMVDDTKANYQVINLWIDQIIHLFQIVLTIFLVSKFGMIG